MTGEPLAVVGLGWGDESKGATVDHLCRTRDVRLVVRHNGGAQAAHNVVTNDGRHHEFSQWGSGTLAGVPTYLSRFMVVDPLALSPEAEHLREVGVDRPWEMLTIDPRALVVTPYHRELQRAREESLGKSRHGTCGMGIGEAVRQHLDSPSTSVRWDDLRYPQQAKLKMGWTQAWCGREFGGGDYRRLFGENPNVVAEELAEAILYVGGDQKLLGPGRLFEGAQGVLLDQDYGYHPHTTWSKTTFQNADTLCREAGMDMPHRIGVTRAHSYRHGPGPFPTEDVGFKPKEPHNEDDEWRGAPRYGPLDLVLLDYAIGCCGGVDELAVTHLDQPMPNPVYALEGPTGVVMRIPVPKNPTPERQRALGAWLDHSRPASHLVAASHTPNAGHLRRYLSTFGVRVGVESYGPTSADRREPSNQKVAGYL